MAKGKKGGNKPTKGKDVSDGSAAIFVGVRIRPLMKHDRKMKSGVQEVVQDMDGKMLVCLDPAKANKEVQYLGADRSREKHYAFDAVWGTDSTQDQIHRACTTDVIDTLLKGCNASVFAYGQTGSGKTHTMIGSTAEPGLNALTLGDLYERTERQTAEDSTTFKITVSFIEVYNEVIRDLLTGSPDGLDLREDGIRGPTVAGATWAEAHSVSAVMQLLQEGDQRRTTESTMANAVSSRSHAVLQVCIEQRDAARTSLKVSKLSLIDLAGSERASKTENRGMRLREGANINRSLLALGNCINALGKKGAYVNYRDSKLTRLLKDSLGGNCRTVMIACVTPATSSFEETLNTLKYANRAKDIKTKLSTNVKSVDHAVGDYVRLIDDLRSEITGLKGKLTDAHGHIEELEAAQQEYAEVCSGEDDDDEEEEEKETDALEQSTGSEGDGSSAVAPAAQPRAPSPPVAAPGAEAGAHRPPRPVAGVEYRPPSTAPSGSVRAAAVPALTPAAAAAGRVAQARGSVLDHMRERMQVKQAVMELEDVNRQNAIDLSRLQLRIVAHENQAPAATKARLGATMRRAARHAEGAVLQQEGGSDGSGSESDGEDEEAGAGAAAAGVRAVDGGFGTQADYEAAMRECRQTQTAIDQNNRKKQKLLRQLQKEDKKADASRQQYLTQIHTVAGQLGASSRAGGKGGGGLSRVDKALIQSEYRIGDLELQVIELEQQRVNHESEIRHRDLTVQKLQLQLEMRDRVIRCLAGVVSRNGLGDEAAAALGQLGPLVLQTHNSALGSLAGVDAAAPPPSIEAIDSEFDKMQQSIRQVFDNEHSGGGTRAATVAAANAANAQRKATAAAEAAAEDSMSSSGGSSGGEGSGKVNPSVSHEDVSISGLGGAAQPASGAVGGPLPSLSGHAIGGVTPMPAAARPQQPPAAQPSRPARGASAGIRRFSGAPRTNYQQQALNLGVAGVGTGGGSGGGGGSSSAGSGRDLVDESGAAGANAKKAKAASKKGMLVGLKDRMAGKGKAGKGVEDSGLCVDGRGGMLASIGNKI